MTAGAVVIWTFAVTVWRGIRSPNDFSEAHWLLDYRFGFIKRGLIGSLSSILTGLLDLQVTPRLITILSAITLCSMFAAMLYLLGRTFRRQQARDSILVFGLVFASSPFVVMSAHLLGYFDALLYCFGLASVGLVLCDRPFFGALVSSAAILVHESYLLICFPLVCLASVGVLTANRKHARWRSHIVASSIPPAVFLAVSLLQFLTTDSMTLQPQLKGHLDSFGFVPTRSERVALWQTTSFVEFFRQHRIAFDERLLNPLNLGVCWPDTPVPFALHSFILPDSGLKPFFHHGDGGRGCTSCNARRGFGHSAHLHIHNRRSFHRLLDSCRNTRGTDRASKRHTSAAGSFCTFPECLWAPAVDGWPK